MLKQYLVFHFGKIKKNQPTGHNHIHIVGWRIKNENQDDSSEHVYSDRLISSHYTVCWY